MYILSYLNGDGEKYEVDAEKIADNLVRITGDYPINTDGFYLSRKGYEDNWNYTEYTTIYQTLAAGAIFSNDGSVAPEPNNEDEIIEEE